MSTVWTIKTAFTMNGHTDFKNRILTVPRGGTPMEKAIRAHEVFHAMYSQPIKPTRNREPWEWLEEARIDWLVEELGTEYAQGIRAFRHKSTDEWLRWGQKSSHRQCGKVAIISRGYKMQDYLPGIDDKYFVGRCLAKISAMPSDEEMAEMAAELDVRFALEGTDSGFESRYTAYTDARE